MVHHAAESIFNGANATNVGIGIVGSLISLWLLFCIKPSLRLTLEVGVPSHKWWKHRETLAEHDKAMRRKKTEPPPPDPNQPSPETEETGPHWMRCSPDKEETEPPIPEPQPTCKKCNKDFVHYRVEMENLGLATLVEVEARVRLIRKNNALGTREPLSANLEKLLALNGKWREAKRDTDEFDNHTGDRFFHFILPCKVAEIAHEDMGNKDYFVIQVWSRHGFTNFGRVHKIRLKRNPKSVGAFDRLEVDDPDARRRRRVFMADLAGWAATAFAWPRERHDEGGAPVSGGTPMS